jgi:hypothetical protein
MREAAGGREPATCDASAAVQENTAAWEPTMSRRKGSDSVCRRDPRAQREMPDHNWNPRGDLQC